MDPGEAGRVAIRRALLSVSDPAEIDTLARGLERHGVELWATQGTRRHLEGAGVATGPAEELTGIGAWFGGRIKTLHPGILGGLLAPRTPEGERELAEHQLRRIDLVAVNFYPFPVRAGDPVDDSDLVERIDIGGVTLARAAAKNFAAVTVLSEPVQYTGLLRELEAHAGSVGWALRRELAGRTLAHVAEYDRRIAAAFAPPAPEPSGWPDSLTFETDPLRLRYGENPHQPAGAYRSGSLAGSPFPPWTLEPLQGEALSYNNLLDLDAALAIVAEFPTPAAAVVKHATPAGVASGDTLGEALADALETDPVARYGCALAVNRPLTEADLAPLHGVFVDLLVAPDIDSAARPRIAQRRRLKLVRADPPALDATRWELRSATGRLLVQEADRRPLRPEELRPVTGRRTGPEGLAALDFAWRVVRHARSNAVVLARGSRTVGIGSGQPSRVKAVELAGEVAGDRARGAVLASDAFFPFPDGVTAAARAGVSAILQPGGSIRDAEVIAEAERLGIAMYFTGWRVFRH